MRKIDIARKIKADGYEFKCPDEKFYCPKCHFTAFCLGLADNKTRECFVDNKAVDAYIIRYSRTGKKSLQVDRPNFIQALKDRKEFRVVEGDVGVWNGLAKTGEVKKAGAFLKSPKNLLYLRTATGYAVFSDACVNGHYSNLPEYLPLADTFTDRVSKFDNEPKETIYSGCAYYSENKCLLDDECQSVECPMYSYTSVVADSRGNEHKVIKWVECIAKQIYITSGDIYPVIKYDRSRYTILDNDKTETSYLQSHFRDLDPDTSKTIEPKPLDFEDELPERCYWISGNSIDVLSVERIERVKYADSDKTKVYTTNRSEHYDIENCFLTLEDACLVAKKRWGV